MALPFNTLDVFTEHRFAGNPLAVVLDADSLNARQMQRIAREFNTPETVFVLKAANPAHTARVRIFTPATEIPFAGHPTVGTAALLAEKLAVAGGEECDALVVLEEAIGLVRVGVRLLGDGVAFAEFDAPRLPEEQGGVPAIEDMAAALGKFPRYEC
jgi:trans-2,3-dihydro-3-hydroxyanthranilate isomerase